MSEIIKSAMYALLFGSIIGSILPGKRFDKYLKPIVSLSVAICIAISFGSFFDVGLTLPDIEEDASSVEYDAAAEACRVCAELAVAELVSEFDPELDYSIKAQVEFSEGEYNVETVHVYAVGADGLEEWLRQKTGMENIYVDSVR